LGTSLALRLVKSLRVATGQGASSQTAYDNTRINIVVTTGSQTVSGPNRKVYAGGNEGRTDANGSAKAVSASGSGGKVTIGQ
jgi:hypothetical protein